MQARKKEQCGQDLNIKKTWISVLFKIVKIIKNSLRNSQSQEEHRETKQLNVIWYLEWDPRTEKGH